MSEWTIEGENGRTVRVVRSGDDIRVVWTCGGERHFSPAGLEEALFDFETIGVYPEAWFSAKDAHSAGYVAKVIDGEFHADDYLDGADSMRHVPWDKFREALVAAIHEGQS